jgi:drug/metabolite transporter (DMT)-like permease
MKHNWEYSICIGTVFFVASQVFLKKSFNDSNDYIRTLLYFTLAITIMTIIGFIIYSDTVITKLDNQHYNAFIAGIFFFIGLILWIYSISMKTKLGIIRTFMAGFETIILFGVGYLIFNEKINRTQSIGVLSILLGLYLIGNR